MAVTPAAGSVAMAVRSRARVQWCLVLLVFMQLLTGGLSRRKRKQKQHQQSAVELIQAGVALGQAKRIPEAVFTMVAPFSFGAIADEEDGAEDGAA